MCASPSSPPLLRMNAQVDVPSTYLCPCLGPRQASCDLGLENAVISAACFRQVACSLATLSSQRQQLGTILLCIAGCGGHQVVPCGAGKQRALTLVWEPGGAGRGAAELRCWVCPRAAGAGGWELPHRPLPPPRGHRRILLQECPGTDLHLPRLLHSANGNGQASSLSVGDVKHSQERGGEAQAGAHAASAWS